MANKSEDPEGCPSQSLVQDHVTQKWWRKGSNPGWLHTDAVSMASGERVLRDDPTQSHIQACSWPHPRTRLISPLGAVASAGAEPPRGGPALHGGPRAPGLREGGAALDTGALCTSHLDCCMTVLAAWFPPGSADSQGGRTVGICSSSLTWVIPKISWTPLSPQATHHTDAGLIFQQLPMVFRGQHSAWDQSPPRSYTYLPLLPPLPIPTSPSILETSTLSHPLRPAHNDSEHLHSSDCVSGAVLSAYRYSLNTHGNLRPPFYEEQTKVQTN